MVEPIREHTYSLSAYLDAAREEDIREDQDVQRLSGQWDSNMINELIYTVLTRDYILPIILGEEDLEGGTTQLWLVDGVQRTSSFMLFRFGNYKITSSMSESHKIIEYQVRCVDAEGRFVKDEEGNFVYETKVCNLVGKTYDTIPKELQKEFDKFQIKTVIHQHCTMTKISELVRRYNNHKAMNSAQTAFTYVDKYARRIRNIAEHKFFAESDGFSEKEKNKGVYERVICETVMTMFHMDNWQKQSKKMGIYLNTNSNCEEFDILSQLLDTALDMGIDSYTNMYNSKDAFIWLTLLYKFNQLDLPKEKFVEFLKAFSIELHSKAIDGTTYDDINSNRATKDKKVIKAKLNVLEFLMTDFFNIGNKKNNEINIEQFISEITGMLIDTVHQDLEFFKEMLFDLEENRIKVESKLREEQNQPSMLALIAYSIQNDIILDEWIEEYAKNNNTYFMDQRKNYLHMIENLKLHISKEN